MPVIPLPPATGGILKSEIGNQYGRLTVVRRAASVKGKTLWVCQCSCGELHETSGDNLRRGKVKSCGCYRLSGDYMVKHGHGSYARGISPTYTSWQEMKKRCDNPHSISYKNYGGRGISYPKEWSKFENFLADMGEKPEGTSLDRINVEEPYSKENCKWSNRLEQSNNRRSVHLIEYNGKTQSLACWCRELEIPYSRTYNRLTVQGKAFEEAIK